ncbi:MAG: DUF2309 domain-containing protein [Thiolinea sp.]
MATAYDQHDLGKALQQLLAHLEHVLPSQAPLKDFVHHNTLHGFQHLPFPEALQQAQQLNGAYGYLPAKVFREHYRSGRINQDDLDAVLAQDSRLDEGGETVCHIRSQPVRKRDLYRAALVADLEAVTPSQFIWELEEGCALQLIQPDVHIDARERLREAAEPHGLLEDEAIIADLWQACLDTLELDPEIRHIEHLINFRPEQAQRLFAGQLDSETALDEVIRQQALSLLEQHSAELGHTLTLRRWLQLLTGKDLMHKLQPVLLRALAAWLDQGMASWSAHPQTGGGGFYAAWKTMARHDWSSWLQDMPDWHAHLDALPDDPQQALANELQSMGLPRARWMDYLERLALELPGWSGMFLWRHQHPGYDGQPQPVSMIDYLAVRLILEQAHARRLCRQQWDMAASLPALHDYFQANPAEFMVRYYTGNSQLPEYLLTRSRQMMERNRPGVYTANDWQQPAHLIWTWNRSPLCAGNHRQVYDQGWRLFRLAQHQGWCGADVRSLDAAALQGIFRTISALDEQHSGYLWLQAYERHYREDLFRAVTANHERGTWPERSGSGDASKRPQAQLIFCMDDREEGIRRHLEAVNPQLETLGAAAFFNIPMNWRGLDEDKAVKLCPVPVNPQHVVQEVAHDPQAYEHHHRRQRQRRNAVNALHQWPRHTLLPSTLSTLLLTPLALATLLAKAFIPLRFGRWLRKRAQQFDLPVATGVACNAEHADPQRSPTQNQQGFTDEEQAKLVGDFLVTHGLDHGFSPLVILMGHYASNQNNPHQAAYGCGACSGRYSGPNARTFAAMANRPEIRTRLAQRGLDIPADCWFLGAEHDTCTEDITWYDTEQLPASLQPAFEQVCADLEQAARLSAHERCRKLASAPRRPSLEQALRHIAGRGFDYSQARPELGHATNAAAFIGRRFLSQGVFWDRRSFLISYDYRDDPEGQILENILLSAGPVGAGISLEYYFSTVSSEGYGAGSKVTHNPTGLFGVMDGTHSDLRTGLPRQMIEIHEPMRLLLVLESSVEIVSLIYQRQPVLQELIGNAWLTVAVKHPDTADIHLFRPGHGFEPWEGAGAGYTPPVACSADWYDGHHGHLPPALLTGQPQPASAQEREVEYV